MRTSHTRSAAAITTLVSGAIAAYAITPRRGAGNAGSASGAQPAEVRTEVIRRTVHVIRHERPLRPPTGAGDGREGSRGGALSAASARTGASGGHRLARAEAGVRTRTSGRPAAALAPGSTSVRTRTSGAVSRGGVPAAPRTRSSGASGAVAGGAPGAPRTRTSGAAVGGGDGRGRDD